MSYYVTNENSFLDIKNAHLRVTGNVHTDVLKLGAIEFQPTGSEVTGTVNFTNVTTGVTTSSNLNVGGTLQLGTVEVVATTHTLANTTALGNVTPHTIEVSNVTTGLVTTANVSVGRDLAVTGNVAVDTDTLFVDSVNDRVGIGTTNPLTIFDTHGTSRISAAYPRFDFYTTTSRSTDAWGNSTGAAGDYRIYANGDASDGTKRSLNFDYGQNSVHTSRMVINAAGNVGIGTTSPSSLLTFYKDYTVPANGSNPADDTIQGITFRSDLNSYGGAGAPNWSNPTPVDVAKIWFQPKAYTGMSSSAGVHGLLCFGMGYSGSQSSTADMVINSEGNVGIGTTTPTELLDITAASGDYDAFIRLRSGSGGTSPVTESGLKLTESGEYGFQFAHSGATDLLKIRHQNSAGVVDLDDIMVWNPNGNVGIGTTSPNVPLEVNGDFLVAANSGAWSSTAGKGIYMRYATNGGQDSTYIQSIDRSTGTQYPMTLEASSFYLKNGNVGIGTTSPVTKLNIEGDSGGVPPTTGGEGTSNGIFRVRDNYNVALDIGTKGSSPWTTWLQVADTTSMGTEYPLSLQPNGGNVGIGTTSPAQKLDVNGVIKSNVPSWNMWDTGTISSGTLNFTTNYVPAQNCTVTLSTGRVTATVAGRYFVSFHGFTESDVAAGTGCQYFIGKNGVYSIRNYHTQPDRPGALTYNYGAMGGITVIMDLAVNDYVDVSTNFAVHSGNGAGFCGFMIG
jgi:hypothetical protein